MSDSFGFAGAVSLTGAGFSGSLSWQNRRHPKRLLVVVLELVPL